MFGVQLFSQEAKVLDNDVYFREQNRSEWTRITSDGQEKSTLRQSRDARKLAFVAYSQPNGRRIPVLRIVSTSGVTLHELSPDALAGQKGCSQPVDLVWLSGDEILMVCHRNPSLAYAYRVDLAAGKAGEPLRGYGFVPSPDGSRIAHVGFMPHFAPPFAHSHYLQVDGKLHYPAGSGVDEESPFLVKGVDGLFRGIHSFNPPFVWSPDSARLAFTEKIFDCEWPVEGVEGMCELRTCQKRLVVCETAEGCRAMPVLETELREAIEWIDSKSLKLGSRVILTGDLHPDPGAPSR